MSLVEEDDSLNGSVIKTGDKEEYRPVERKATTLRDRILEYVETHEKPTKGGIFTHVSASGSAGSIVSALIQEGIFIEKKFDCGNCVYFELDKAKINIV